MKWSVTTWAMTLLVLGTVPALAAGEDDMRLSAENGVLEFSAKGMRLTGGRPGLTLLVGEEEKLRGCPECR